MTLLTTPLPGHAMTTLPSDPDDLQTRIAALEDEIRTTRAHLAGVYAATRAMEDYIPARLQEADWDDQSETGRRLWYLTRQASLNRSAMAAIAGITNPEPTPRERQYGPPPIPEEYIP